MQTRTLQSVIKRSWLPFCALLAFTFAVSAQVPALINYQAKVQVGAVDFNGAGQFKFALVNRDGSTSFWSNDGTSAAGSAPAAAVSLPVVKGVYSLQLGDITLPNMATLPPSVFNNFDLYLRVWFSDGVSGFQQLSPDSRLVSVPYAMIAGGVANQSIGAAQLSAQLQQQISELVAWQDGFKPAFGALSPPSLNEDVPASWTLAASNSPTAWSDVNNALPPGMSINNQGVISGTPMNAGTYTVTLNAANVAGSRSTTVTLTVQSAIYVDGINGDDTGAGTRAQPLRSLAAGAQKAYALGRRSIRLSAGNYPCPTTVRLDNLIVRGAFNAARDWEHHLSYFTQLIGHGAGADSQSQGVLRLAGNSTLEGLSVASSSVPAVGFSSIGVVVESGLARIIDCGITAGNGGPGAAGLLPGANGRNGQNGEDGTPPTSESHGAGGGQPASALYPGGLGGVGGAGNQGMGNMGGFGSAGAIPGGNLTGRTHGQDGADGANGVGTTGQSTIGLDANLGVLAAFAPPGASGTVGGGGGGGRGVGSHRSDLLRPLDNFGGGGGAGGQGGEGGAGGGGGQNGGASIALLIAGGSTAQVERTRLVSARGGAGGSGGALGGMGGAGGAGGLVGATPGAIDNPGGNGGNGGKGGNGAPGSPGSGGPSFPLASASGATVTAASVTYVIGQGGAAGGPGASVGEATESKSNFPILP